jgi:hypothetical protein
MAVVSPECVAAYAYMAGFRGNDVVTAVAVAKHESGFRDDVTNSLQCVGLWQIRQPAHPEYTAKQLTNPFVNAQAAFKIWTAAGKKWCATGNPSSHNCNPWQAYGSNQAGDSWNDALKTGARRLR